MKTKLLAFALTAVLAASSAALAASPTAPTVDFNAAPPSTDKSPFGYFKIVQCDGPEQLNHINPESGKIESNYYLDKHHDEFVKQFLHEPPFVPCDFRGLIIQAQFLVNAMIIAGVLIGLIGIGIAGAYYISGVPKRIETAKKMFPKLVWGFIIMLTAWVVVYEILHLLTGNNAYLSGSIK